MRKELRRKIRKVAGRGRRKNKIRQEKGEASKLFKNF